MALRLSAGDNAHARHGNITRVTNANNNPLLTTTVGGMKRSGCVTDQVCDCHTTLQARTLGSQVSMHFDSDML